MRELLRPRPLAVIVAAFALGWGVWLLSGTTACGTYDYVNADVACGDQGISKAGYVTLRNDISRYIDEATSTGRASEVSVYYRDLRDGPSFGIGAGNAFAPASLLKLPIIISFFSLNADEPGVLEKKLRYDPGVLDKQFDIARQINFDF